MKSFVKAILVLLIAGAICLVMVGCGGDTSPAQDVYSSVGQVSSVG